MTPARPHAGRRSPLVVACTASLLALAGCRGEAPEVDSALAADPVARWAALLPDRLRHGANACPFECCVYRDRTPTDEVPLRPEPIHSTLVALRIPAGETFRADSGFVWVTRVSLVAVLDSVMAEGLGGTPFLPGDTLVVLDYVGEGFFNVWDGGRVREVAAFWRSAAGSGAGGAEIRGAEYAREWWVHATTRSGRTGRFDADSVAPLRGADTCA